jgi:hypothetical protein
MTTERNPENPFLGNAEAEETDPRLVSAAVTGDRKALSRPRGKLREKDAGGTTDEIARAFSRPRGKLREYMSGNCGGVNPEAPCRCRKEIRS